MISGFLFDSGSAIPMPLTVPKKDQMSPAPTAVETPAAAWVALTQGNAFLSVLTIAIHFLKEEIFFGGGLSFTWQSAQVFDLMGKWW